MAGFKDHLKLHWPAIKASLLAGEYMPLPVRRGEIPKPQGDGRVHRLIRRYLQAGMMAEGIVSPRLRIALASRQRLEGKIRDVLEGARGRSRTHTIQELNPVLRGWAAYFKLTETKRMLEDLDGWLRHKLRAILWRQWKRRYTRAVNLMKAGPTSGVGGRPG